MFAVSALLHHSCSYFLYLIPTVQSAKEKPPINVVGDVGGRIAIVIVSILIYKKYSVELLLVVK